MLIGRKHIVGLLLAGVMGAFVFAWSGLIGVGASTGHWKATDWFLHWVMRSSVRTAALGTKVPVFTDGMVAMAAGHFEAGCSICHGSPALARPKSVARMLPAPPDLKDKIADWTDAELFQIVQHGIRFTGMPAWPAADREDEAWAMVAFLRRYPVLDAKLYRDLAGYAATQSTSADKVLETCNGCHRPERLRAQSLIPDISGQSARYLQEALAAYANGTRPSGTMTVAIQGLKETERRTLARYFANQPQTAVKATTQSALVKRGEALASKGNPGQRIPACLSCHDGADANPAFPRLSGQAEAYLANQLRLFVGKKRGGGPFRALMTQAAANLGEQDIVALAAYFATRNRP